MKNNKGEMILVILLIAAVGLTIGLSVAGRSVSDTKMSTQIEESSRAFSAAETGIEEVLRQGLINITPPSGTVPTIGASYNVSLDSYGSGEGQYTFSKITQQNQTQTVWLIPHGPNGPDLTQADYNSNTIFVCLKKESPSATIPAVEISILFQEQPSDEFMLFRNGYDPDNWRISTTENGFNYSDVNNISSCVEGDGSLFDYEVRLQLPALNPSIKSNDNLIAMRIRPVYANAKIAVRPQVAASLPEQGKNITSTGQTTSGVSRRWNVTQTFGAPQDIFDYAVWSYTSLEKEL